MQQLSRVLVSRSSTTQPKIEEMRLLSPKLRRGLFSSLLFIAAFFILIRLEPASAQNQQTAIQIDSDDVLQHLNHVITWYRHIKTQIQPIGLPTDALYQSKANDLAVEAAQYAFQSAYKVAPLLPSDADQANSSTSRKSLLKLQTDTATRNTQLAQQIDALSAQIASASKKTLPTLTDQRDPCKANWIWGNP
jgi:hypothetical protein